MTRTFVRRRFLQTLGGGAGAILVAACAGGSPVSAPSGGASSSAPTAPPKPAEKSAQAWSGERGAITRELLERHLIDPTEPIYYLAGPPAMTIAMLDMLSDLGVADDAIQSEEFYGY